MKYLWEFITLHEDEAPNLPISEWDLNDLMLDLNINEILLRDALDICQKSLKNCPHRQGLAVPYCLFQNIIS